MERTRWQLGQLDALRGIAILGVLLVHTSFLSPETQLALTPVMAAIVASGQRGVQLFFLASAFTLALSNDNRRKELSPVRNFFIRRFFRIAPMYYVALVLARLLNKSVSGSATAHLLAFTFTNGFSPKYINLGTPGGWSVADEAIFYVSLPLLLYYIRSFRSAFFSLVICCALSRFGVLQLTTLFPEWTEYWSFHSMVAELPIFLMGICIYFIWKDTSQEHARLQPLGPVLLALAILIIGLMLPVSEYLLMLNGMALALLLFALLLYPWRLLVNRVTIWLGKLSFSMYLLHFYVFAWLERRRLHLFHTDTPNLLALLTFVLGTALVLPLAALCWYLIEKPGIALGSKLIATLEHRSKRRPTVPPLSSVQDTEGAQF